MIAMIDNITLVMGCVPPKAVLNAEGRPFEHSGIVYYPKYLNGEVYRYDGYLRNLRLSWHRDKVELRNSLHKYWHGNNFTDFHLYEFKQAVGQKLTEDTGIDWSEAAVKYLEVGCNIEANASLIYNSLHTYKNKPFTPMRHKGKIYGADCELTDYRLKGYDKTLQAKKAGGITLDRSLFRWEVAMYRHRSIAKRLCIEMLRLRHLLVRTTWEAFAQDAILKYLQTAKMQALNLHKIEEQEPSKRVEALKKLAIMLNPQFCEYVRTHHRETYKNYKSAYSRILSDKSICGGEDVVEQLRAKFSLLIGNKGN